MELQKSMSLLTLVYALGVLASLRFSHGRLAGGSWNGSCIESEKQALLLFKNSLLDDLSYMSSWVGDDCCAWHGIGCNNNTGHIIQVDLQNGGLRGDYINPSLLELKYLTYLDLSSNNFDYIQFPEFFGSFQDLTYLNLSFSGFEGIVPHHLGNLSSLQYLDLNNYDYDDDILLTIDSMRWLSKLSSLKHLDLSNINLSSALDWFPAINMLLNSLLVLKLHHCHLPNNIPRHLTSVNLTSLTSLDLGQNRLNSSFPLWIFSNSGLVHLILGSNYLNGPIPKSIGSLTSLSELDLSFNNFEGLIPESIGRLNALSKLDLSNNNFQGLIPKSIGNLTALSELGLSGNNFQGLFPQSVGNLTNLSSLDLSFNNFQGLIVESNIRALKSLTNLDLSDNNFQGLIPQSIGNFTSLAMLFLANNKFNDSIPPELGNLTKLTYLSLRSNELRGCLPETFCQLSKLEILNVGKNQLSGSIPKCIGELSNLQHLDLSSCSWEGFMSEHHFVNLTRLNGVFISSKSNLVLNISSKWVPPFQLRNIYLESLKVGPKFPRWILTQTQINYIWMRNTSISDTFPTDWFVSALLSQALFVDLSNNDIRGEHLSLVSAAPNGLFALSLSNNRLSGKFPEFLCNLMSLSTLVLSNNKFSGELPQCLGNMTSLRDFDVMNNGLIGEIPTSLGSSTYLTYLNLHNNMFHGKLPLSFQNLTELVILDVGKNNLTDILPVWTGEQLPLLKYLILRSNNFHGEIPTEICHHSSIQVLNLARNNITGHIPPCFGSFSAMITSNNSDLHPAVSPGDNFGTQDVDVQVIIDDAKGHELKYTSTLGFLYSIDLSNNNISGEIPEELMALHGLLNLNLAGNQLSGKIPDTIGKLKKLEFLDLSRNELNGSIPQSLSDLNFLSRLNLSFNDLSGRIPTGNQLQTLDDPSIYVGNNQLCGQPILKPCDTDSHNDNNYNEDESHSDSDDERMWFYTGIGPGLLVGFLGFCASLYFVNSCRNTYFHFVEHVLDKLAVAITSLQRKFHY